MGYFPSPVRRDELHNGDHVYYYRAIIPRELSKHGFYTHHGIYVNRDEKGEEVPERVIHFDWRDHPLIKTGLDYAPREHRSCTQCEPQAQGVRKSCVDCFVLGDERELYRCEYGQRKRDVIFSDAGTCSTEWGDEPNVVVQRARAAYDAGVHRGRGTRRGRWRLWNNCESFAYFCKTGKKSVGKQIKRLTLPWVFVVAPIAVEVALAAKERIDALDAL